LQTWEIFVSDLDRYLATMSRADPRHPSIGRLEQLVWERISLREERIRQRRVRSSVLVFSIAAAFVGGIIIGGRESDTHTRGLLVDDAELLLPAAIN
jgi:hypothetical protein